MGVGQRDVSELGNATLSFGSMPNKMIKVRIYIYIKVTLGWEIGNDWKSHSLLCSVFFQKKKKRCRAVGKSPNAL